MKEVDETPTRSGSWKHVFGPVFSRRLGMSLGIDPIPQKTCNWNCVYCQLGRTTPLTGHRGEFVPAREILSEVHDRLASLDPEGLDWVTIVGSGEPLLNSGIGALIRGIKATTKVPLAVITNGSLFSLPEVRKEILPADAVLPTLDVGSAELFRLLNRKESTTRRRTSPGLPRGPPESGLMRSIFPFRNGLPPNHGLSRPTRTQWPEHRGSWEIQPRFYVRARGF